MNAAAACCFVAAYALTVNGCWSQGVAATVTPRVRVESGELAGGVDRTLIAGKQLYKFLGIPYASPPVYKNRFKVGDEFFFGTNLLTGHR